MAAVRTELGHVRVAALGVGVPPIGWDRRVGGLERPGGDREVGRGGGAGDVGVTGRVHSDRRALDWVEFADSMVT